MGVKKKGNHGLTASGKKCPEMNAWWNMIARCTKPSIKHYSRYGGRGIKVCKEWMDSFQAFYSDMGPRPEGMTIDRIDNNGDYCPSNCRWASRRQQSNNRECNHLIAVGGESHSISEWSRRSGINRNTIIKRLRLGWSSERAVTTPVNVPAKGGSK